MRRSDLVAALGWGGAILGIGLLSIALVMATVDDRPLLKEWNWLQELQAGSLPSSASLAPPPTAPAQEPPPPPQGIAPDAVVRTDGPWIPGTTISVTNHYPQPGVAFNVGHCTIAFTFQDSAGASYAVTAGHCGNVGDLVWPSTASTMDDFSAEVGRFIYTDLDVHVQEGSEPGNDPENGVHDDIGIISIADPLRTMPFAGNAQQQSLVATAVLDEKTQLPGEVCKIGGTTGVTCGALGGTQRQHLYNAEGTYAVTEGRVAYLCGAQGDSGGPVVGKVGEYSVVLGLVSGTRSPEVNVYDCSSPQAEEISISFTPSSVLMDTVLQVVPDAQFTPVG